MRGYGWPGSLQGGITLGQTPPFKKPTNFKPDSLWHQSSKIFKPLTFYPCSAIPICRPWAEVFHVTTSSSGTVKWTQVSEDLVPVNITCVTVSNSR